MNKSSLVIPLDINENRILLGITESLSNSESVVVLLSKAATATRLKWGAMGIAITVLSIGLIADKAYCSGGIGAITAISMVICRAWESKPVIAEAMSTATFVFFLFFSVRTGILAWKTMHRHP